MKDFHRVTLAVVTGSLIMVFSCPQAFAGAFGQDGKDGRHFAAGSKSKMVDRILENLHLSEEQLAQIKEKRTQRLAQKEMLGKRIQESKKALEQALDEPATDPREVDRRIEELSGLMTERFRAKADAILELKQILTEEQFAELRRQKKEMIAERRSKWKSKWHDRH